MTSAGEGASLSSSSGSLADAKDNLAKHVPFLNSLVGLGGASESVSSSDWDLEVRIHDSAVEPLKFANPGNRVIREHFCSFSFSRNGLDTVRIGDPAAVAGCIQTLLKSRPSGKR